MVIDWGHILTLGIAGMTGWVILAVHKVSITVARLDERMNHLDRALEGKEIL